MWIKKRELWHYLMLQAYHYLFYPNGWITPNYFCGAADHATYKKAIDQFLLKKE